MSDFVEIQWTSGSLDEARRVSRYLVQKRLVASAHIIPWIESIYMWNNQLETGQESRVTFKTRREKLETIKEIILKNASYEIPEITFLTIEGGNESYLDWISESVFSEDRV